MRTHSIVVGVLVAMGTAAAGQSGRATARPAAGYVIDVSGDWIASHQRPLALGDGVLSGDSIRAGARATAGQRISVVVRGTDALHTVCEPPASRGSALRCRPLAIPSSSRTAAQTFSRVMTNAMALVRSHEERRYASLVSRGAGGALTDAVVALRGDGADLDAAFVALDSGRYDICLRPISADDTSDDAGPPACVTRAERKWPMPAGQTLLLVGLHAGLYEVRLGDGRRAWVLATGADSFPRRNAEFARMKATVQQWGDRVPEAAKRRMLRAYLAALAADDARD